MSRQSSGPLDPLKALPGQAGDTALELELEQERGQLGGAPARACDQAVEADRVEAERVENRVFVGRGGSGCGGCRACNGQRCEPFTVRDAFSRFVFAGRLLPSKRGALVRRVLEELFAEYGTPGAIQCDNGPPFVSTRARGGLTELSTWLVSLGIRLIRSRPAKPQDNGGHERMHRDMAELELTPAASRRARRAM